MELIDRIFSITFPIFSIVALGVVCGRWLKPDMRIANRLNMDVFVPALIFSVIVGQAIDVRDYLPLIIAGTAIVLGSGIAIWPITKLCHIEPKTLVPPMMFNNAGNMGLPLVVLTFGEVALPLAMILFLVENTLHFTVGMYWLNNHNHHRWKAMVSPLTIATITAIGLGTAGIEIHPTLLLPIDMLGDIVIPLMLFSLGVRLSASSLNALPIGILGGIACPAAGLMIAFAILPFIDLSSLETGIIILFAALPPAILNFMFAERYQQEPEKVASIVIVGNALTFITLPLTLSYVIPRFDF